MRCCASSGQSAGKKHSAAWLPSIFRADCARRCWRERWSQRSQSGRSWGRRGCARSAAIKRVSIPVHGTLGFKKAEVTAGGVALDEVRFQHDAKQARAESVPGRRSARPRRPDRRLQLSSRLEHRHPGRPQRMSIGDALRHHSFDFHAGVVEARSAPQIGQRIGASALAVCPLSVWRAHKPLGSMATPGRSSALTFNVQRASPERLKTRTGSPSAKCRAAASSGCSSTARFLAHELIKRRRDCLGVGRRNQSQWKRGVVQRPVSVQALRRLAIERRGATDRSSDRASWETRRRIARAACHMEAPAGAGGGNRSGHPNRQSTTWRQSPAASCSGVSRIAGSVQVEAAAKLVEQPVVRPGFAGRFDHAGQGKLREHRCRSRAAFGVLQKRRGRQEDVGIAGRVGHHLFVDDGEQIFPLQPGENLVLLRQRGHRIAVVNEQQREWPGQSQRPTT